MGKRVRAEKPGSSARGGNAARSSVIGSPAPLFGILLSCIVLAGCGEPKRGASTEALVVFCAAAMRTPVEEIAVRYEREHGVPVELHFGGSGTLLAKMEIAPVDVYLPADGSYIDLAVDRGLVTAAVPVASLRAGLGVPVGNPEEVASLRDLFRRDLKVGIAHPEAAAVGRHAKNILTDRELWSRFEPEAVFPTVTELANAIRVGALDVAILWDSVAAQYPDLDFVRVEGLSSEPRVVAAAVISDSSRREEALRFCRFLGAGGDGGAILRELGYEPAPEGGRISP